LQALIHLANVLYLCSYLVKDIFWLRALTVVAGLVLLAFYALQPTPLLAAIAWNVLFAVINVYQLYLLFLERRPVALGEHEQRLYRLVFRSLTPREFVKLLAVGRWEEARADERLVESGRALDRVMVIFAGKTAVRAGDKAIAELGAGQFVGEMSFLTGQTPTADVVAVEPTRYVAWPTRALSHFLETNPALRAAIQLVIGTDLVGKLRAA
jgi:CRP-like cAMP-binding protein